MKPGPFPSMLFRFDKFSVQHWCYLVRASSQDEAEQILRGYLAGTSPAGSGFMPVPPSVHELQLQDGGKFGAQIFAPALGVGVGPDELEQLKRRGFQLSQLEVTETIERDRVRVLSLVRDGRLGGVCGG